MCWAWGSSPLISHQLYPVVKNTLGIKQILLVKLPSLLNHPLQFIDANPSERQWTICIQSRVYRAASHQRYFVNLCLHVRTPVWQSPLLLGCE